MAWHATARLSKVFFQQLYQLFVIAVVGKKALVGEHDRADSPF
jgi:hypothetical protein